MTVFEPVEATRPAAIKHITNKRIIESIKIARQSFSKDTVTAKSKNAKTPQKK
jgi:hypothetical protein